MKVYCFKDNNDYFTVGKWYDIIPYVQQLFVSYINEHDNKHIRNDEGFFYSYHDIKQYFLTKEILREQKLNRILNG